MASVLLTWGLGATTSPATAGVATKSLDIRPAGWGGSPAHLIGGGEGLAKSMENWPRPAANNPAPTTIATPAPRPSPFVTSVGGQLVLGGKPFRLVGINTPQAATLYTTNLGCGAQIDLDAFFASLAPSTAVRVGFLQDDAVNPTTGARDWRGFDRVIKAAEQSPSHPKLIVDLTSQSGTCDANYWKGSAWYEGGYRGPVNDQDSLPRSSYWDYIQQVVPRYRNSPAIALWEPVGEPEPSDCAIGYVGGGCYGHTTCPADASGILRRFFDAVGAKFKQMDPNHLISDNALGGTQCGWTGQGPSTIDASQSIDVLTYHDYWAASAAPVPPELAQRLATGRALRKPVITDEAGMAAGGPGTCPSVTDRAATMRAKMEAGFASGLQGFLTWAYGGAPPSGARACDYYIFTGDPLLVLVQPSP